MRRVLSVTISVSLAASVAAAMGSPSPTASPGRAGEAAAAVQEKGYPFQPYDGRLTFVRLYFDAAEGGGGGDFDRGFGRGGFGRGCGREPCWHHDYPYAETNLTSLLAELTLARAFIGGNVIRVGDPELHRFPIAWLAEPGHWTPDEKDVKNLREYLLKGGFIIFDDFGGSDMDHLVAQLRRVLPELQPIRLDGSEPIFHSFFDITPAELQLHSYRARREGEQYFGYFESNDRSKRQLAILNDDNDVGEFIEYNDTGFSPVNMTNEAYKLAVNYYVYALTH